MQSKIATSGDKILSDETEVAGQAALRKKEQCNIFQFLFSDLGGGLGLYIGGLFVYFFSTLSPYSFIFP